MIKHQSGQEEMSWHEATNQSWMIKHLNKYGKHQSMKHVGMYNKHEHQQT